MRLAAVSRDVGVDFDEFLCSIGKHQGAHEVAEDVGDRMKLEPDDVLAVAVPRQACPHRRVLAFLDSLRRPTTAVEGKAHPLARDGLQFEGKQAVLN